MKLVANGEETIHMNGDSPCRPVILVSQLKTRDKLNLEHLPQKLNIIIGQKNEELITGILEDYFGMDLYKDEATYAKCDFYNAEEITDATHGMEVKGRVDINHDLYPTGFVDVHKVAAHLPGKEYYYLFIYKDGVFYTPYVKERFDSYEINESFTEWRVDVGRRECSPKYEVPVKDMIRMCSFKI